MNGDSPVVRTAKASDAAAIAALQVRSWKAAYLGIVPDASRRPYRGRMARAMDRSTHCGGT